MPKFRHQSQLLGQQGVNLIEESVLAMGYAWHPTNQALEVGVDGHIEIRDKATGQMSGSYLFVQSKARTSFERETDEFVEYTCSKDDLDYWLCGTAPVLLVISKPAQKAAWWVSIKDYFRPLERRKSRKIRFDKSTARFDATAAPDLLALSAATGSGTYFRPPPKFEMLISNLLPVTRVAEQLYRADTPFTERQAVFEELKRYVEWPDGEFVLSEKAILSVHDLRETPWSNVCERGTVEKFATSEWKDADDQQRRKQFTQLLNRCLARRLAPMGLRSFKGADGFFYKASKPVEGEAVLRPRRTSYQSRKVKTSRDVFAPYFAKGDPTRLSYYRHVGFDGQFRRYGGTWFLSINPTYHYTLDGHAVHPFAEEYLAKIKLFEGNNAVAGTVVMFSSLLQDEEHLFRESYPHLGFGMLERFQLEVGIEDQAWGKRDELQAPPAPEGLGVAPAFTELFYT